MSLISKALVSGGYKTEEDGATVNASTDAAGLVEGTPSNATNSSTDSPPVTPTTEVDNDDIDDQKLLAALQKRGVIVASLNDLQPTPPKNVEEEAEEEIDDQTAEAEALSNNFFTKETLDGYKRDKEADKISLAKSIYRAQRKAELSAENAIDIPSDEVLDTDFEDTFFTYEDPKNPKFKSGQRGIDQMVESYLQAQYGEVMTAKDKVKAIRKENSLRSSFTAVMDQVGQEILNKPMTFTIPDQDGGQPETYTFTPKPEHIEKIKALYADPDAYELFSTNGKVDKNQVKQIAESSLQGIIFTEALQEVANAHAEKRLIAAGKGRRGIPVNDNGGVNKDSAPMTTKTPGIQKALGKKS